MTYRDSSTDASRDGADQKRLSDPDVMVVDTRPWTLADEKKADPDSVGTASDYAHTTTAYRDRDPKGFSPQYADTSDEDDRL